MLILSRLVQTEASDGEDCGDLESSVSLYKTKHTTHAQMAKSQQDEADLKIIL